MILGQRETRERKRERSVERSHATLPEAELWPLTVKKNTRANARCEKIVNADLESKSVETSVYIH